MDALPEIAKTGRTTDPLLARIGLARSINQFSGGAIISPWQVDELDEACKLPNLVINQAKKLPKVELVLNNSFGMLGINSCLIIKKFKP